MAGRWAGILLLSVLLTGCAIGSPAVASSKTVDGLRTDADQRGLAASYIGGSCDGPARLAVEESADRIQLSIVVEPDPDGRRACNAMGHLRTVSARLQSVLGVRSIWSGQTRQVPFDGSHLLVPSALPAGFKSTSEQGTTTPVGVTDPTVPSAGESAGTQRAARTDSWTLFYSEPAVRDGDQCRPSRGTLAVVIGADGGIDAANGWVEGTTIDIGGRSAHWWRQGGERIALQWVNNHGPVTVISEVGCQGDRLMTPAELGRFARSLQPS